MFEQREVRRLSGAQDLFFFLSFFSCGSAAQAFESLVEKDLSDATKDQQEGRKSLNFILSHPLLPWKLVDGKRVAVLWLSDRHAHRRIRPALNPHARFSHQIVQLGGTLEFCFVFHRLQQLSGTLLIYDLIIKVVAVLHVIVNR